MRTSTESKSNRERRKMMYMALTAIFAALITVMTAYIFHVPVPLTGGYIHFGDGLIFLAACILPRPYAMAAGAIGGGLADLLTAPMWTLPTIVVKMLIVLPFTSRSRRIMCGRNIIGTVLSYIISATGYYIAESFVFGYEVAFINSYLGSLVQATGSTILFIVAGIALDKVQIKKKIGG